MLNKVHHVTYVVESISDMAVYMENSFGVKPISTDEFTDAVSYTHLLAQETREDRG